MNKSAVGNLNGSSISIVVELTLIVWLGAQFIANADSLHALQDDLAGWMAHPALQGADVGIQVLSVPEGTSLYSLNHHQLFIPASTVKLVVTASALELLGADFVYHTMVWLQEPPDDQGTVAGDMIIGGTADPEAPQDLYDTIAKELTAHRLHQIMGNIVGVAPVRASDKDSGLTAAQALKAALQRRGVAVHGQALAQSLPLSTLLVYRHQSSPLSTYIRLINKHSDNERAQRLLTSLTTSFGDSADREHSFLNDLWQQRGSYVHGLRIVEGSGLSAANRLSPAFVADLLVQMTSRPQVLAVLLDSLPVAGGDGTLRHRLRGTLAQGRLYAKTGTLHRVSCLSGYVVVSEKVKMAFSVMMNNYTCSLSKARRIQDEVALRLVEYALSQHLHSPSPGPMVSFHPRLATPASR